MDLHATILQAAIEEGRSLESGLAELHAMGVTSKQAVRAIRASQQMSLVEARKTLAASNVWVSEAEPPTAKQRAIFWLGIVVVMVIALPVAQAIRKNFVGIERAAAYLLFFALAYVLGKVVGPWLVRRIGLIRSRHEAHHEP